MPTYDYKCPECGAADSVTMPIADYDPDHFLVCVCTDPPTVMARRYSFLPAEMFVDHYNNSVGSYVTSMSDLKSKMSRASDEATARTGIPHNFSPVELRDIKPPELSD